MPRKTKTEQELNYLRSFWDEVRTLQADYTGAVGLYAYPTQRPGVWSYRLVYTPLMADSENMLGSAAVQFEFPNGTVMSFAGCLWAQSMKLTELVSSDAQLRAPRRQKNR